MNCTTHTFAINEIIKKYGYKRYLEIGLHLGINFFNVDADVRVGVEPVITMGFVQGKLLFEEIYRIFNGHNPDITIEPVTSDKFFEKCGMCGKFDLIFVDGLHLKEQALKDIENSLKFLNDGGMVLVHDTNPPNAESAGRNPDLMKNTPWNGDVFKAIIELRVKRYDLDISTLPCEFGLTVIKKGIPEALLDEKYLSYEYEDFAKERELILNVTDEA